MAVKVPHTSTLMPSRRTAFAIWILLIVCTCRCTCAPIDPAAQPSATAQCSPQNKNPCETFPALCSAGGGSCVSKDPCEYQCLCPDGRLGRDCSKSSKPDQGSVVDSLLIFPKDIFADVNHVSKSEAFANSKMENATNTVEGKNTTDFLVGATITLTHTVPSSRQPTTAAAAGQGKKTLPSSPGPTSPFAVTTLPTVSMTPSDKSSLFPVPSPAEPTAGSSMNESTIENSIYPASRNNSKEQSWISSNDTGKPADTSTQPTVTTSSGPHSAMSNFTFHLNLSLKQRVSTQGRYTILESSTVTPPTNAGKSNETEAKGGSAQAAESLRQDLSNPKQAETIHRTIKNNVILSEELPSQSAPTTTIQPQQESTQQQLIITTTASTTATFSSTQDTTTQSQETSATTASSTVQSTPAVEEFPTLFKLTLDNQLSPSSDTGKNSALSMVVHRVFLPIEAFQPAQRSAP